MAKTAAVAGVGFAILAEQVCKKEIEAAELKVVQLDIEPLDLELYAYYSNRTLVPPKIKAFLEHLETVNAS